MNTPPPWLCEFPVTDAVRYATESLRRVIPARQDYIEISFMGGTPKASHQDLTDTHISAALLLAATAAFQYELMCKAYGETISEADNREPETLRRACAAFDEHAMRTLRIYADGHVLRGEMSGTVRVYR